MSDDSQSETTPHWWNRGEGWIVRWCVIGFLGLWLVKGWSPVESLLIVGSLILAGIALYVIIWVVLRFLAWLNTGR
jgi:hypothetical protein